LVAELIADPDAALAGPGSTARRRVGRKLFYRLAGADSTPLYVKLFRPRSGIGGLLGRLFPSKAWHEAQVARQIAGRGFAAALPVAVGEERRAGLLQRSFSVIEERAAIDLRALLGSGALPAARRRALIESFGALNRRLHDAGIDQDDTSPNNFLVSSGFAARAEHAPTAAADPWILIDFERCRVGRPLSWSRRTVLLAKLQHHELGVSRAERLRFLRAYLAAAGDAATAGGAGAGRSGAGGGATLATGVPAGSGREQRRSAWSAIHAGFARLRVRDARRAARGAFQVGRHVGREGGAWIVRGRERDPVLRLELGRRAARRAWVLAHQLERLGLPALRPARLDASGLALVAPALPAPAAALPSVSAALVSVASSVGPLGSPDPALETTALGRDRERAISRARRLLERYGRFVREPRWFLLGDRAFLQDLEAFRLG
jgi:hypothetical protein